MPRIDRDERPLGPLAIRMDRPRDELFTGSALAFNKDAGGGRRSLRDDAQQFDHGRTVADKFRAHRGMTQQVWQWLLQVRRLSQVLSIREEPMSRKNAVVFAGELFFGS